MSTIGPFELGFLDLLVLAIASTLGWRTLGRLDRRSSMLPPGLWLRGRGPPLLLPSIRHQRSGLVPQVLAIVEHLEQGRRERRVLVLLICLQLGDFAPDQAIGSDQESQTGLLMPEDLELTEVPDRALLDRVANDVQVLKSDHQSMQPVHHIFLIGTFCGEILLGDLNQIEGGLREPSLLGYTFTPNSDLAHLVERHCTVDQVISVEPLDELPVGLFP